MESSGPSEALPLGGAVEGYGCMNVLTTFPLIPTGRSSSWVKGDPLGTLFSGEERENSIVEMN